MLALHDQIAALVHQATDGAVSPDHTTPLSELGVDSLGWLRLLDALEATFGREINFRPGELRAASIALIAQRVVAS